MIQGMRIKNFQAHKRFSLRLDPKVTTIIGPSDVGKSSILRALYWCCFNKPSGRAFIKDGTDEASVQVRVDGITVERRRNDSENLYVLGGGQYKSFGTEPPVRIKELLNLDEINFQWQHDALFWLALSPGQVARELNRIVDLSVMDSTISLISAKVRNLESQEKMHSVLLDNARNRVEGLKWVKVADAELSRMEDKADDRHDKGSRVASLVSSIQRVESYQKSRERSLGTASEARKLVLRAGKVMEHRKTIDSLSRVIGKCQRYRNTTERSRQELDRLRNRMPKTCPICNQKMS